MAANNLNIGIGVVDQTQAGISSVVNRLSRAIPANLAVQIEAVLGKNWQQALSTAEKDVNKLDELLSKFNKTSAKGKTSNTFTPLYEDAQRTQTAIERLYSSLNAAYQKAGRPKNFTELSYVKEAVSLMNQLNSAASPSAMSRALSNYDLRQGGILKSLFNESGMGSVVKAENKFNKELDRYLATLEGSGRKGGASLLKGLSAALNDSAKTKGLLSLSAKASQVASSFGLKSSTESAMGYVEALRMAFTRLQQIKQIESKATGLPKDATESVRQYAQRLREMIAIASQASSKNNYAGLEQLAKFIPTSGWGTAMNTALGRIRQYREELGNLTDARSKIAAGKENAVGVYESIAYKKAMSAMRAYYTEQEVSAKKAAQVAGQIASANERTHGRYAPGVYGTASYQSEMAQMRAFYQQQERDKERESKKAARAEADANRAKSSQAQEYRNRIEQITASMRNQHSVASDLRNQLVGMYSIYQIGSFLKNIVDIGGQFEYQRAAIGAILGDLSKANTLFNEIKALGLKSPFGTLDLDQYTKQLSAFDIQYYELYDKLKQIGDISAGTGTDMGRIIYAYGHVRSQGFMNAMQARMFTNANIPVIPMLKELYSERNGEVVSTADIYKMLKGREVSYEDIDEVFNKLTTDGGRFENMQEIMAETVKGTWKNLGDAVNHMYLAIENSTDSFLKGVGAGLTGLTKIVGNHFSMIVAGLGTYGAMKLAVLAYNSAIGSALTKTTAAISVKEKEEIANLRLASSYRVLTREENKRLARAGATERRYFGGARPIDTAYKNGAIDKNGILKNIHTGKYGAQTTLGLIRFGTITKNEAIKANSAMKKIIASGNAVLTTGQKMSFAWRGAMNTIKIGATEAGAALKGMWSSLWPMLLITGVIEGITAAVEHSRKQAEKAKAFLDAMNSSVEDLAQAQKNLSEITANSASNLDMSSILAAESDALVSIKDNLLLSDHILEDIYAKDKNGDFLYNAEQRAAKLEERLGNISKTLDGINGELVSGAFRDAENGKATKTKYEVIPEDLASNLNDYASDMSAVNKVLHKISKSMRAEIDAYILEMSNGIPAMQRFIDENGKLTGSLGDQLRVLRLTNKDAFTHIASLFYAKNDTNTGNTLTSWGEKLNQLRRQYERFAEDVKNNGELSKYMGDPAAFANMYAQYLMQAREMTKEYAEQNADLMASMLFGDKWKFNLSLGIDPKDLTANAPWKRDLIKALTADEKRNSKYAYKIRLASDIDEARKIIQETWDAASKKWDDLNKYAKTFGINIGFDFKAGADTKAIREQLETQKTQLEQQTRSLALSEASKTAANLKLEAVTQMLDLLYFIDDLGKNTWLLDTPRKSAGNSGNGNSGKDIRDKALEALKKEEKQVNDVVAAYEDLLKTMTKIDAVEKMRNNPLWMDAFKKFFPNGEIDEANMARVYRELAQKVPGLAKPKDYGKMTAEEKKEYEENRNAFITDLNRRAEQEENKEAQRAMQDAIRNIDIYMNKQKQMYDLYEKMYAATGDAGLAGLFAFGKEGEGFSDKLEKFKSDFKKEFNSKFGDKYSFDDIMGMSEEKYAQLPDSLKTMFDRFKKELETMSNEKNKFLVDLYKGFNDTYTKISQIDAGFAGDKNTLDSLAWLKSNKDLYDRMLALLASRRDTKRLELTAKYISFFDEGLKNVDRDIKQIGQDIKSNLVDQFAAGNIVFSEFVNKLKDAGNVLLENRLSGDSMLGKISGRITRQDVAQGNINKAYDGIRSVLYEITQSAAYGNLSKESKFELVAGIIENDGKKLEKFGNIISESSKKILKSSKDLLESGENAILSMQRLQDVSNIFKNASGITKSSSILSSSLLGKSGRRITNAMNIASSAMDGAANTIDASSQGATQAIQAAYEGVANLSQTISAVTQDDYEQEVAEKKQELEAIKRAYEDISYKQNKLGGKANLENQLDAIKNIEEQRDKVQEMLQQDVDRASSYEDPAVQAEYENQIYELERKMQDAWRDFWKDLGLDLKSFSSQLTDALTSAWEKGEDAALAWNKTVGNVLKDFAKNWYGAKIMEQFLNPLDEALFGEGGMMTTGNQEDFDSGLKYMKDYLQYDNAQKFINNMKSGYDVLEQMFPDSFKEGGTSGITASEKALTESTGNILASYVDAIRLYSSESNVIARSQLDTLNRIDGNVMYIAGKMDAVENAMMRAQDYWDAVSMGTKRVAIQ